MRDQVEAERVRREAWQNRRRSARAGWEEAIDALYVQLFGDPRDQGDLGAIGEIRTRLARLERLAAWTAASLVLTLLALIADLVVRITHP